MDPARHRAAGWWRSWRRRPRPRFSHWPKAYGYPPIVAGTGWVAAAQGAWAVVTGGADPWGGRGWAAVAYTLGSLAVALPLTWLCWAYVRRPVEPYEPYLAPAGPEERRLRDQAERLRWAPKSPHGDV